MGSEDFNQLVKNNRKGVYDFIWVGIADPELADKAKKEGEKYLFYNHNGNYLADLAAIPLGTVIGATALLEMFK